jgi:hypothetical protein
MNTASDRMVERQETADCVLPDANVQKFLLDVLDQTSFPGKMAVFVAQVQATIRAAVVKG